MYGTTTWAIETERLQPVECSVKPPSTLSATSSSGHGIGSLVVPSVLALVRFR